MSDPKHAELRRLFERALELPLASRATFVDRECAADPELKRRLLAMLAAFENESFLGSPAPPDPGDAGSETSSELRERPGTRIGPYVLLRQIGEGGFGVVFLAEQEKPVARQVALKIIKLGMDTRQVVARFEQERQALALMEHPNIARVIDAGATDTGRPYFVMELVQGVPIAEYCDQNRIPVDERLDLFAQVCVAVQHAHSKGLIHRDLKPSNILVATLDGRAVAKIIDFGIAKATSAKLTDKTLFTEENQVIGTLQYMSPEQAQGSLDIDTRADVYALGVVLYELLTGTMPFDTRALREAMYGEIQRIIRDVEPPKPSTRLRQSAETLARVATQRRVDPRRLRALVSGELDWIVMKALEKDRARRYESASALAQDVRRYLSGEAVAAAPPGTVYRLGKFVRRNKGGVTAVALVAAALVLGLVGTAWQARRAGAQRDLALDAGEREVRQRKAAESERDKAQRIAEFMGDTLEGVGPHVAVGRDITLLKEMMDAAAARIENGDLQSSPEAELRLRTSIGRTYTDLALFREAATLLEPAVSMSRSLHPGDHEDTARALSNLAFLFHTSGDRAAAKPLFREALEMRQRLFPGDHPSVASSRNDLAIVLQDLGDLEDAEPLYRESLAMRRRLYPGDHRDVAISLNSVSRILKARDELDEAERLLRESLAMQKRLFPGDHPDLAVDLQNLARMLQDRGDLAGAELLYREALAMTKRLYAGDSPLLASGLQSLALLLRARGDPAQAETLLRESLEMRGRILPGDNPGVAADLQSLGILLQARGDVAGAEPLFRDSLEMNRRLLPGDHANKSACMNNLAHVLLARGDPAGAEPFAREAVAMFERMAGKDAYATGNAREKLGRALAGLGRFAEAESELLESERVLSTAKGVPPGRHRQCVEDLAQLYASWESAEPGKGHDIKAADWKARVTGEKE